MKAASIYTDDTLLDKQITILNDRCMTKQVPLEVFCSELSKESAAGNICGFSADDIANAKLSRLMDCISVKEPDGTMHLLCDDARSLMRTMYNSTLIMLRSYEFPENTPL